MTTKTWSRFVAALMIATPVVVGNVGGAAAAEDIDVYIEDFRFVSQTTSAKAGDTIVFRSNGGAGHTVTSTEGLFDSGSLYTGDTYAVTLTQPGVYNFFCAFHGGPDGSGMAGTIVVEDDGGTRVTSADDNIARAVAWSQQHDSASVAVLARSDLFADSLPSGALQGLLGAPLLLTAPSALDGRVSTELTRLGVGHVIVLGGERAISPDVIAALEAGGRSTERISGPSRYATAVAVARRYFSGADTAIIARAEGEGSRAWADALGAGGLAARLGAPVLFTAPDVLPGETADHLRASSIKRVIIAGGTSAVSEGVEQAIADLGVSVERASGPTRFHTALALAQLTPSQPSNITLIDGGHPQAWSSGFAAASTLGDGGVIVLTDGGSDGSGLLPAVFDAISSVFANPRPSITCGPLVRADTCDLAAAAATATELGHVDRIAVASVQSDVAAQPDPSMSGTFFLMATNDPTVVCYDIYVMGGASAMVAAHVHDGGPGESGPPVISLVFPEDIQELTVASGCTGGLDAAVVADVLANPADYYVNYHTEDSPSGAARGQLRDADFNAVADLSPAEEVPPVDAFAFGVTIALGDADNPEGLCFAMLAIADGQTITAAHIHQGAQGENGDVVMTLSPPQGGLPWSHFCATADAETAEERAAVVTAIKDGGDFYVNVHTEENPGGVMRAQLNELHVSHADPDVV